MLDAMIMAPKKNNFYVRKILKNHTPLNMQLYLST